MSDDHDEKLAQEWYDRKSGLMAELLGPEHDMVGHSVIPYAVGGGLDLYYYLKGIAGTAIATKELCEERGEGSSNDIFDNYELVMFTRHRFSIEDPQSESTPFGTARRTINAILNCMGRYSAEATLNPYETCEFPEEMEPVGGRCLIFDAYGDDSWQENEESSEFGLLAIIEIHRSEMEWAQENGGEELLSKLKEAGCYPYSDLDRPAVV